MDQNNSNNNNNSNSNSNNNNNDRIDNRLVFPDKFLGRQDELNTLMELYRGVCAKRDGSSGHAHGTPLVLIGGYSGVGKSHLVKQFCKSIAREAEKQQQPQPQQPPQHYFSSNSNSNRSSSNSNSSSNRSNSIINGNSNSKNRKKRIKPCYFLSGKYDETISADPFSGIVQAFNGFCQTLLEGDAEELERMRNIIQKAVGDEGKVVTDVVPNLIKIIGEQQQPQQQQPQTQQGNSNTSNNSIHVNNSNNNNNQYTQNSKKDFDWNRLLYVFKNFVSGISSSGNPLVLFLDDVQWIDEASMDLVFDLVQNKTENLMLLGSYRSNEMDDDHPMSIRLSKLEDDYNDTNNSNNNISDTNNSNTTTNNTNTLSKRIELDNLSLEHVSEFIAATLRLDVEEVASLAEVVYSKTHGNIYFTEQTLEDLQRKQVLYKSLSTFQWTWNMEIIEQVVGMSANVVDMVTSKLSALPELLQKTLAVAAYMKNTFDRETLLSVLLEAEGYENIDADMLDRLLEVAVEEGLLMEHLNFQFTHDRIKQAARELIPEGKKQNAFRVRLGKHLVTLADSQQGEDWMLFVAADHLNAVTKNDMSPLEVATLNLNVGEKAVSTAAFIAALKYLKIGMEALHHMESPWENHYHLALGLHRATANVELCFGDFDKGQALCLTLIEKTPSVREQLRIKLNLADALGQMERHKEAMNIHLDALYSIKGFPRRFLLPRALREFSLVKNLLKKYADHEICALPPMADENTLSAMEHLSSLALRSFMCGNEIGTLVCVLRMIQTTFRCGLCAESAQGFAYFGQIMSATGGILVAKRLATLACQVLEKVYGIDRVRAKNRESIVLSINAIYVDAYAVPIPQILESLQHAHKSGMESGDLESGYRAWASSNVHAYSAGFPLDAIHDTGTKLFHQLKQYRVKSILSLYIPVNFTYRKLIGISDERLDWDYLDKMSVRGKASFDETFRNSWWCWSRIQLAYYFGELEIADKMYRPFNRFSAVDTAFIMATIRIFFSGLVASAMYRKTGKRVYKRRGKKMIKDMERILKNMRGLNNLHRFLLMQADLMASEKGKSSDRVKQAFDKAIGAAAKAGFRQDAALGNELAGEYFVAIGDTSWPEVYFSRSYDLYLDWGANAKAEQLKGKRQEYIKESLGNSRKKSTTSSLRHWVSGEDSSIHTSVNLELLTGHSRHRNMDDDKSVSSESFGGTPLRQITGKNPDDATTSTASYTSASSRQFTGHSKLKNFEDDDMHEMPSSTRSLTWKSRQKSFEDDEPIVKRPESARDFTSQSAIRNNYDDEDEKSFADELLEDDEELETAPASSPKKFTINSRRVSFEDDEPLNTDSPEQKRVESDTSISRSSTSSRKSIKTMRMDGTIAMH